MREDAMQLVGFLNVAERELLLTCTVGLGVGFMAILAQLGWRSG
ncbi:MAG: hypothetical protein R2857_07240 [Vampirovibrionales bacterium]